MGNIFKSIENGRIREESYYKIFKEICDEYKVELPEKIQGGDGRISALNLWKTSFGSSPALHKALDELQIRLARKGDIVIDGKLAVHMMSSENIPCLKVWLHAEPAKRIIRIAQRENKKDSIERDLLERENIERTKWKEIYGFDYFDQYRQADMIIDTTNIPLDEIVGQILNKLNQ